MRSATATPSSSALCASIGPRTTSPTAQTLGADVRHWSSTWTKPRSSRATPAASGFRPEVLGTRPIETISLSTASVCAAPLASVYSTATPFLSVFTAPIFTPSWIASPCLVKIFWASLAICSSAAPRNPGSASRMVTCAPRRRQTEPISRPMTPAPITPSRAGAAPIDSAPSLLRICFSSKATPGSARALDPVATITWRAVSRSSLTCTW